MRPRRALLLIAVFLAWQALMPCPARADWIYYYWIDGNDDWSNPNAWQAPDDPNYPRIPFDLPPEN
jgi:hypothetical protein